MKILHVIGSMNPESGGPCQGIRNTSEELSKLGVDREVVCLDDPKASFLGKDPFFIHALGRGKSLWRYNPKLLNWLLLNLTRFDVVIVNGLWLYHGYAVRKALNILHKRRRNGSFEVEKIPRLYVMPHGMLDPYFQNTPSRRMKAVRNWLYWKFIENKLVNEAYGLLFTCNTELELAKRPFHPYYPKKEINVGYGITLPPPFTNELLKAFQDKCPGIENKKYILFISRIHEKKGLDLLIKAYINILRKNKDNILDMPRLVVAGPGLDTFYGQKIQKLIKGIEEFVFFPGMLMGDAKWGAFYGSSAFILPSHQENFGIAMVEALACSKPVFISNKVNICTEVMESKGGIVAEDTYEGTYYLLESWLAMSEKEKEEMGEAARSCFENNFEIISVTKRFVKALQPDERGSISSYTI